MKKTIKRLISLVIAASVPLAVASCGGGNNNSGGGAKEDPSKLNIHVYNYDGGYGSDWLQELMDGYAELHKDTVYEGGKVGVNFIPSNTKKLVSEGEMRADKTNDIFFLEGILYDQYRNSGLFADMTSAVTSDNPYEKGTTIESRLTAEQKAFYGVNEGGETHYYALPHYSGYYGIIYNVALFEKKGYFFAKNPTGSEIADKFVSKSNTERSAGPDGAEGTFDDGLPATYEEFYDLCKYIVYNQQIPFVWTGKFYELHLMNLYRNLVANYEGVDKMMLNYTLDGVADDLGTVDNGGNFVPDGSATTVTAQNGYELSRQAGKFYAMEFMKRIISEEKWKNAEAFGITFTHMDAQARFLKSWAGQSTETAMLIDGSWWENEASQTFSDLEKSVGEEYSKQNTNYAWMPLPKANASKIGDDNVLFDHLNAACFVNAKSTNKEVALDFIQYANTRESLVKFTKSTNTVKALDYTLTDEEIATLTPYGKSMVTFKQAENTKVIYPYARNATYVNSQAAFTDVDQFFKWTSANKSIVKEFAENRNSTVKTCFDGLYTYRKSVWKGIAK